LYLNDASYNAENIPIIMVNIPNIFEYLPGRVNMYIPSKMYGILDRKYPGLAITDSIGNSQYVTVGILSPNIKSQIDKLFI